MGTALRPLAARATAVLIAIATVAGCGQAAPRAAAPAPVDTAAERAQVQAREAAVAAIAARVAVGSAEALMSERFAISAWKAGKSSSASRSAIFVAF